MRAAVRSVALTLLVCAALQWMALHETTLLVQDVANHERAWSARWNAARGLALNTHAESMLSRRGKVPLLVTFGSSAMLEFLENWVAGVQRLPQPNHYLVAALDNETMRWCTISKVPALTINLACRFGVLPACKLPGEAHGGTPNVPSMIAATGAYVRESDTSFAAMGEAKVSIARAVLSAGHDIILSDLDVAWTDDPWPYLRFDPIRTPYVAWLLTMCDVASSSDTVDVVTPGEEVAWNHEGELNTGMIFFRATAGGEAAVVAWLAQIRLARWNGRAQQDQKLFKLALGRKRGWSTSLKKLNGMHAWLRRGTLPMDVRTNIIATENVLSAPPWGQLLLPPSIPWSSVHDVFRITSLGEPMGLAMGLEKPPDLARPLLAVLPPRRFQNGHVFFSQHVSQPIAVHATHSFDLLEGKRERLRSAGLWHRDTSDPVYSQGRFLHLLPPELPRTARHPAITWKQQLSAECAVLSNGSRAWRKRVDPCATYRKALSSVAAAGMPIPGPWDPAVQVEADSIQRKAVQKAMLLALVLNRTLILPKLQCFCDRSWWLTEQCRFPGVSMELPFECPTDILFTTSLWRRYKLPFRESNFLSHHGASLSVASLQLAPEAATTFDDVAQQDARAGTPLVLTASAADVMHLCACGRMVKKLNYAVAAAMNNPVPYCAMEHQLFLWSNPPVWDAKANPRNCSTAGVITPTRVLGSCAACGGEARHP